MKVERLGRNLNDRSASRPSRAMRCDGVVQKFCQGMRRAPSSPTRRRASARKSPAIADRAEEPRNCRRTAPAHACQIGADAGSASFAISRKSPVVAGRVVRWSYKDRRRALLARCGPVRTRIERCRQARPAAKVNAMLQPCADASRNIFPGKNSNASPI
jgi:hypothetical protein